ncbi:MAG: hypothetical protein U9Q17_04475 [Chloroflexota bacterium]|nr:hypothetical protein [Chloroflexota bacterium]
MWRRKSWRFYFGLPPIGFYSAGTKPPIGKEEYLGMLEDYKKNLEEEIKEVEREIAELKKET